MQVPLIKGDKIDINTDYRDALPINMYAVEKKILGADGYMLCYPGLTAFAAGTGLDRAGMYNERQQSHFRVSGNKLLSISPAGVVTELGTVSGTKQAAMAYSFNTQCIVVDGKMFLYDGGTLTEVVDLDLGNPIDVIWVDNYYFLTDGEYIFHTDIDDEESIDPLKYATAEFMPDPSNGVSKTQDNKAMVWGRYSLEYFRNVATPNFAFKREENRAQKIGIVATHAKCESSEGWYIAGGRRNEVVSIHLVKLGSSEKVATREIDKVLSQYTEPELVDMRIECRMEDDTTFILIHLPEETLCFNETIAMKRGLENAWSILKSYHVGVGNYSAINGVFDARNSEWIYGDKFTNSIGKLDNTVFTQYGILMEWILYTPLLKLETKSIDKASMETLPGNAPDEDATVAISLTYDGITYGTEWFTLYGENLDRSQRFIIRRLGYVADWVGIKFRAATKSRMAFAMLNIEAS